MINFCVFTRRLLIHKSFLMNEMIMQRFVSSESAKILKLTTDQQQFVLQQFNDSTEEQLERFNIPKNRLKLFYDWRKRNGRFNSLVDILEVKGFGAKTLDKACRSILQMEIDSSDVFKEKLVKPRGQLLTPAISSQQCASLTSALGIHLHATGLSWARIERFDNYLKDWNQFEFNFGTKRLSPTDLLNLVLEVSVQIPTSDMYIFEAPVAVTPTAQQSPISISAYTRRVQLLSMLMTLLSTSPKHNPTYAENYQKQEESLVLSPKVFFLRQRLPARLFQTLIGTERISAANKVSDILNKENETDVVYTALNVEQQLRVMYETQDPVTKEILGQALLLTMAFMDVCIYQNTKSLKAISSISR